VEGVKRAKSLNAADVANAIRSLSVDTLLGRVSYEEDGDLQNPTIYIFQVREGQFVQVFPER